jgi:hypothetical protein
MLPEISVSYNRLEVRSFLSLEAAPAGDGRKLTWDRSYNLLEPSGSVIVSMSPWKQMKGKVICTASVRR